MPEASNQTLSVAIWDVLFDRSGAASRSPNTNSILCCLSKYPPFRRHPVRTMAYLAVLTLCILCIRYANSQSTTWLPPPPKYNGGRFTSPDTSKIQQFSQGSTMNVSWSTSFPSIHLYLIFGTEYNSPRTLLFGSTRTSYEWDVDDNGNNTLPFSFRIVSAEGTEEDLRGGGFYTGQFWVQRESGDIRSTVSPTTTTTEDTTVVPTDGTSSKSATIATVSSTGDTFETSSFDAASSTISSMTSTAPAILTSSTTFPAGDEYQSKTVDSVNEAPDIKTEDSTNTTAIGVGVGVGAGIGAAALTIAAWFFYRRHRRKQNAIPQQGIVTPVMADSKNTRGFDDPWTAHRQEMPGSQTVYEFASNSPVEATSRKVHPSELQGSEVIPGR